MTTVPSELTRKLPSRVYLMSPLGDSTWKKPGPVMARSSSPAVLETTPSVKTFREETGNTPLPTSSPVGMAVVSVCAPPGQRMASYIRSAKSTCDSLNPVVLALARLLAMVSMRIVWASMPVAAVCIAFI